MKEDIQEKFIKCLEINQISKNDGLFILAVSGGMDSMALLHLMAELGFQLLIAHCNFGLRAEAEMDENFVRQAAQSKNIPFVSKKFETQTWASEQRVSIQMAARELRYAWFAELMEEHQAAYLATAHHLDDSVETIMLGLVKNLDFKILNSIPQRRDNILRPLINCSKSEIHKYLIENNFTWREDLSNQNLLYQRNFIRLDVLPRLEELNPSFPEHLIQIEKMYHEQFEFINRKMREISNICLKSENDAYVLNYIDIKDPLDRPLFLQWFGEILNFNYYERESLCLLPNLESGKKMNAAGWEVFNDRKRLLFLPSVEKHNESNILLKCFGIGNYSFRGMNISIEFSSRQEGVFPEPDDHGFYANPENLSWPLVIRIWQNGDKMKPLGMSKNKKISDILIDSKVPLPDKKEAFVVLSGTKIVYLKGFRVADEVKIKPETRHWYKFSWKNL